MRESVPGKEVQGVKVAKGPIRIRAVAEVQVMAMNAWMVKIKMIDGSYQVHEGLSVGKITAEFPEINIKAVVDEVKTNKPKDT